MGPSYRCCFPRTRPLPLSLSHRPHLSAVPNLSPTISPLWTRPRPRVFRPHPSPRVPFEPHALLAHLPSLICTPCPALSPSLSLCPREQGALPSPVDAHCLFRGRRRARALFSATVSFALLSATRDILRCALSLPAASGPRSLERFLMQPESAIVAPSIPLCLRRCFATPTLLLEVSNLLVPLIWSSPLYSSRDCSPEQSSVVVSPLCGGLRPLVPLRQREGHGRVRQIARIAPRPVPKPREPRHGRPARLQRTLVVELSGATALRSGPQPLDLGRPSEIGRFRFHQCRSDRSPPI
jgi:hypothetical protein